MSDPSRTSAKRRWPWATAATLGALVVAIGAALVAYVVGGAITAEAALEPQPLRVATLKVEPSSGYTVSRSYVGTIEPRRRSGVGFELSGRLTAIHIDEGDTLEANAVVAELDTQRLTSRRAELVAARREAEARADLASIILRRTREAFDKRAATQRELDEAQQEQIAAAAAVTSVDRRIESVDVDLAKSVLHAPFAAVVAERRLDEGRVVDAGTVVAVLLERASPEARVGVPPRLAEDLPVGTAVTARVNGGRVEGELRRKLPVTSRETRTVELVIALDTDFLAVREGDLVNVALPREVDRHGVWLPLTAMTESVRGLWSCFVAEPIETAEAGPSDSDRVDLPPRATHRVTRRQLEIVHVEEERAFVVGTLNPGERVVREGLHRIVADQGVRLEDDRAEDGDAGAGGSP